MRQIFLKEVANYFFSEHKQKLGDYCFVFPSRRAGIFFSKYLSDATDQPMWSPAVLTINDLIQQISHLQQADNLTLTFELYSIYKKEKKSQETFNDFYSWGEIMLNDFDDIDKYMVHADTLFKNLNNLKSIEDTFAGFTEEQIEAIRTFWKHFEPTQQSIQKKDFIRLWEVLQTIYFKYKDHLRKKETGYEGMIYRDIADKIKNNEQIELPYGKIVFVGFNALNTCEHLLFKYLKNTQKALFMWDYDNAYIHNAYHEAGRFLRENIKDFPQATELNISDGLDNQNKNIQTIAVPTDIGQAKYLAGILNNKGLDDTLEPDKAAIVLADENLLIPVINSLPENIQDINITMGFPVKSTPAFSLVKQIIALHKNSKPESKVFYHQHVLNILNHQYLTVSDDTTYQEIISYINSNNRIYVSEDELKQNELLSAIFTVQKDSKALSEYLLNILYVLSKENVSLSALDHEYIQGLYLSLNKLNEIIKEYDITISTETFLQLLGKITQNQTIPFTGEPLKGMQVMGLLETRSLDFDHLIILSMNEGKLPKTGVSPSYIPYNLRKGFGLPTMDHQDAIFAYYFYRMIQRAHDITLLYTTQKDNMNKSEISRYIYQLKYETTFGLKSSRLAYHASLKKAQEITITKEKAVLDKLDEIKKALYPSAVNSYINCPLQFYFKYVAGIKEPSMITEEIDPAMFGSIIHRALFNVYKTFGKEPVEKQTLEQARKNNLLIENSITEAFNNEYFINSKNNQVTGRNIIVKEIIKRQVHKLLETDIDFAPFSIINLENKTFTTLQTDDFNVFHLYGKIDRIDKRKEVIRVIDYKSGEVNNNINKIDELFDRNNRKRNSAFFQALYYSKIITEQQSIKCPVAPSLYPLKSMFNKDFTPSLSLDKKPFYYQDIEKDFTNALSTLLQEIVNPYIPFIQTEDTEICKNCAFVDICRR